MNQVCTLVPTYPPRYKKDIIEFIASYKEYRLDEYSDLCFVFANEEDSALFKKSVGDFACVVLPKHIDLAGGREIINIKKLYGVKELASRYEYILVMDDDCRFCKNADIYGICSDYFQDKILIANQSNGKDIVALEAAKACRRFFRGGVQNNIGR